MAYFCNDIDFAILRFNLTPSFSSYINKFSLLIVFYFFDFYSSNVFSEYEWKILSQIDLQSETFGNYEKAYLKRIDWSLMNTSTIISC